MSSPAAPTGASSSQHRRGFLILLLSLGVVLLGLFSRSFSADYALFSNDGPLAVQVSAPYELPGAFAGIWNSLYWIGAHTGNFSPNVTGIVLWLLGPYGYSNFHLPISLLILACCAWYFFRELGLAPLACLLGGLAAALNGNFFSNGAWGLSSRALSLAMAFLALAAIEGSFRRHALLKTILAGLAIGLSISEGGDNGAIFSLFIAAYAFARTFFQPGALGARLSKAVGRVALMAVCAAILSLQTLNLFMDVAVKGVVGTQQDAMTKDQKWDWATQWSLPPAETLRVVVPGLYGYRMDTPEGGNYWGSVGQTPGWSPGGPGYPRYSGAGEYAGVLVVLVALWAFVQSFRKTKPIYSDEQKKLIWFWVGAGIVATLLAWGRHAPLYRLLYELPYFSTIRNPMKFMHPAHLVLMILFAYGVTGLFRRYLQSPQPATRSLWAQVKVSWKHGDALERRWFVGSLVAVGAALLVLLIYSVSKGDLVRHLTRVGFDPALASQIAAFSIRELGLFFLFLALSVAAVLAVQSNWFGKGRATWMGIFLGLLLVVDLARANTPWIQYYNYAQRYASNPVLDIVRDRPHEHRLAIQQRVEIPQGLAIPRAQAQQQLGQLQQFYTVEWLQHHFQYYNLQSLDVAQEPRMPEDKAAFVGAMNNFSRYWQLTNTRYIFGLPGPFVDGLNQQLAPGKAPFRQVVAFDLRRTPEGYSTALTNSTGPFALIEDTEALPRAKLFTQWQVLTNNQAALARLGAADFDPAATVIVNDPIAGPPERSETDNASAEISSYSSRRIELKTSSTQPGVLLLNDRYHPSWVVEVDGQSRDLLRCNFIVRGVYLEPGEHRVVFRFAMRSTTFYITLASVLAGLALCAYLFVVERRS